MQVAILSVNVRPGQDRDHLRRFVEIECVDAGPGGPGGIAVGDHGAFGITCRAGCENDVRHVRPVRLDGRSRVFLSHFLQGGKTVFPFAVNNKDFLKRADFLFEVFDFFINGFVADKQEFNGRVGDDVFPGFRQFLQIHGDKSRTQSVDGLLADKPFHAIVDDNADSVAFG